MSTLATVRNEVKANLTISNATQDAAIDGYIRASLRSQRQKRYWFLRRKGSLDITSGSSTTALPSDFSVPDIANLIYDNRRYSQDNGFELVDYRDLSENYLYYTPRKSGKPYACALGLSNDIETNTILDQDATIELIYYAQDAVLPVNDDDTSYWFDDGFDVIRSQTQLLFAQFNEGDAAAPAAELTAFLTRLDEKEMFYRGTGQLI